MNPNKIVVLTGAGISAESGLKTFRDDDGLWNNYSVYDLATPEAFAANPQWVLDFYNDRRKLACEAQPNAAHRAIARLEEKFEVVVITQNVDDLHERGGSSRVIHLHGELTKARSTAFEDDVFTIGNQTLNLGDLCPKGAQLRPHIVWFGEAVPNIGPAIQEVRDAGKVLVVGTSLAVYPAAGLLDDAPSGAEKIIVSPDLQNDPGDYTWYREKAASKVPGLVDHWLTSV